MEDTMSSSPADSHRNQEDEGEAVPLQVIIVPDDAKYRQCLSSMEERRKEEPKLLNSTAARSSCSIFRVPQNIMNLHPKSFGPEIVSIGPYHHGQPHLLMIQEHKWRILDGVLQRLQAFNVGLGDFFRAIEIQKDEIKAYYSENIDKFNDHELIEMMILDGCFIIELLCVVERIIIPKDEDPIFKVPWILPSLTRDLLRLENQIPFVVLQTLYGKSVSAFIDVPPLQELILELCKYSFSRSIAVSELRERYKDNQGKHLLDFYRSTFIPASAKEEAPDVRYLFRLIQPVEKLREAGIEFEESKGTDSFLNIKFRENGVLEMPRLVTDDMHSCFLLNCIAFEQCYMHRSKHFTSYVVFMSSLINTAVDAGHLREQGIIENFFGTDKQVVKFFNKVGRDIAFDIEETYLGKVFKDVNDYYGNKLHVKWAEFKSNYFGSPWIFISALAASVALLLTILQSFYAVYAYYKPSQ